MDCAGLEAVLPDLLDGQKDALAEAHLASCPDCRARFRDLATTAALVADLADAYRPPADADAALQRSLYDRLRRRRIGVNPGWLAVAAALGAALTAVVLRTSPTPSEPPRVEPAAGRAPDPSTPVEVAPAERPASARPMPTAEAPHAGKRRRFREAVQAVRNEPAIEPVLDAYAADPEDAEEALALDETLGGYFDDELRPRLLQGYLDRATSALSESRWLEGCEAARLAHRLDRTSAPVEALLARCESEAARIAAQAAEIPDDSARRTMLRGALLVATPGSAAYRAIEAALAPPATEPPPELGRPEPR